MLSAEKAGKERAKQARANRETVLRSLIAYLKRLDEAGLAALDALGKVTDVVRVAGNHGMDDPFYRERYEAKVWAVAGQRYTAGFDANAKDVFLEPDVAMGPSTELPLAGARGKPPARGGSLRRRSAGQRGAGVGGPGRAG